jgi:hypothetical protein
MPQSTNKGKRSGTLIAEGELLKAVQKLASMESRAELLRVYARATLARGEALDKVAEAHANEAEALAAMERIATGRSTDVSADLVAAEQWALWHAQRVAAESQMEMDVAAVVQTLMAQVTDTALHTTSTVITSSSPEEEEDKASPVAKLSPYDTTAATENTKAYLNGHALAKTSEATKSADTQLFNGEVKVLQKGIVGDTMSSNDHGKTIANKDVDASSDITAPELVKVKENEDGDEDDRDAPAAENASTRTPSPRDAGPDTLLDHDEHPSGVAAAANLSSGSSSTAASHQGSSLAFPKLTPPAMSVKDITSAEDVEDEHHQQQQEQQQEKPALASLVHRPKRLCFEDHGLRFTQADFDAACEELQKQRSGADKKEGKGEDKGQHATVGADGKADRPATSLTISTQAKMLAERVPPPPRHVEDAGLHYVRRQLSVRHLQPYACPLKALALRLAEGDAASFASAASDEHEAADSRSPHLSDPLMLRMLAELKEVCLHHPVPRVRVRPDAQVYRKERGYFKADEVRVQLHVEVAPVSGPMAGEAIHVWVRVPAGYPFVAPRAHLTVELPHRRCTGVAVDKVPHLIALSYDTATPNGNIVCPTPPHAGEVEQLRPLHGAMNSHWRSSLTLRHVLIALSDLFNADEFAETARELQNENLLRDGLQRARVNMFEEEGGAAQEATSAAVTRHHSTGRHTSATRLTGSSCSSSNDGENTTCDDSIGVTTNTDDEVAPAYLLLCNGPFLTKPAAASASPTTRATPSFLSSAETSMERPGEADADDDEGSVHTACSTPSRLPSCNSASARRRQRKPLVYNEMASDRLSGPWRGCWGHVLYSGSSSSTGAATGVTTLVPPPIRVGGGNANASSNRQSPTSGAARSNEASAFAKSPSSAPTKQVVSHPLTSSAPLLSFHKESDGALFIRMRHHVPTAPAATVRLVRVSSNVLREQDGAASLANSPLRRARGRLSPQSAWVTSALGTSTTSAPPGTVWSSAAPSEMGTDVLICVHDDEKPADAPVDLASTMPLGCQRQHVNLHDVRDASAVTSSTVSLNNNANTNNSNNVAVVTSAIVPQDSPTTAETNSAHTWESVLRGEEDSSTTSSGERCYAVVVDVPAGQAISIIFSSDEAACLLIPWGGESATQEGGSADAEAGEDVEGTVDASAGAVDAVTHWDVACGVASHNGVREGVLVELPYDEWQFLAASASTAVANGAKRDEDVHPHWPRSVRFHGGAHVIPLSLTEATFRMYQLLQNTQIGSRSNVHANSYLAAAPYARVRQAHSMRNVKDQESMVRRYGFWGWRNVLLPVFSSETCELVYAALQAGGSLAAAHSTSEDQPRKQPATSAKMLMTALRGWEEAAVEDFGFACVQLHRSPDASLAYRAPFRPFAVLRTLTLTVAYVLEVLQTLQKTEGCSRGEVDGPMPASGEVAALRECLHKVLLNAMVLAVVTAAVKPAFLEACAALMDAVKQGANGAATTTSNAATCVHPSRGGREAQLALEQLSELQRGVAQVLAASTMSAFPKEAAELLLSVSGAVGTDASPSSSTTSAVTSMADRVAQLLNAPTTPVPGSAALDEHVIASRVSAFTQLI